MTIDSPIIDPDNTKSGPGTFVDMTFNCWDTNNSDQIVDDILNEIITSLTITADTVQNFITLTNHNVIRQDVLTSFILNEVDTEYGDVRHGVLEFQFELQEK